MHLPVNAGDLSLTALVGTTNNGHLIVLADGDRADLWLRQNCALCLFSHNKFDVIGIEFLPNPIGEEFKFIRVRGTCWSLWGYSNVHCLWNR